MNSAIPILPRAAMAILLALMLAGTAVATEQPPVRPEQQRAWLASRLMADMRAMGTFSTSDIAETVNLVDSLTDEQVALMARLYCLMREIAEQDARLLAVESSETLVRLRRQIRRTYWELVAVSPGCRTLCEVAYASVSGWCALNRYVVPDWYYRGRCYVGPCRSARYGGVYSVRAYRMYYGRSNHNDWRTEGKYFHENVVRHRQNTHGGYHRHATAAKTHAHAKPPHATGRMIKHGRASKVRHGSPAGTAKHRAPHKGRQIAAHPAKHGGSPSKARHRNPKSKSSPHSQSRPPRPQRGPHAPKVRPAAHAQSHPQHPAHGQGRQKSGHARHK